MKVAYQTDIGHQRKENQDRVAKFTAPDGTLLVVVADGIGGSRSGDVAAQTHHWKQSGGSHVRSN